MNSLIGNYGESDEEEDQELAQQPPKKVQRSSPSSSSRLSSEHVYEKGEQAFYQSDQPCVIVAKHMDDYPNLYYTIRLIDDGNREKQTTAQTLSKRDIGNDEREATSLPARLSPTALLSPPISQASSSALIGIEFVRIT